MKSIVCIDHLINPSSGVWLSIFTTDEHPESPAVMTDTKAINHLQLKSFLNDQGYLSDTYDTCDHAGNHVQKTAEVDYDVFIRTATMEPILYEYLKSRGETRPYRPELI